MPAEVILEDLGLIDYKKAWDYQEKIFKANVDLKIAIRKNETQELTKNYLLFCEHPHVYTLGKSGDKSHLLLTEERLEEINATYYNITGGDHITHHRPRQLVMYPIFDLESYFFTRSHKYMRSLEGAVIWTVEEYAITGGRVEGFTGGWLDGGKSTQRKIRPL